MAIEYSVTVTVPDLVTLFNIQAWIRNNGITDFEVYTISSTKGGYLHRDATYTFVHGEDAVAFKLRWL